MVNYINLIIEMSPHFALGQENVPCVAEVVNRSFKADCADFMPCVFFKPFYCRVHWTADSFELLRWLALHAEF